MHLHFTAVRLNVPALIAIASVFILLGVGGPSVAADGFSGSLNGRGKGDVVVAIRPALPGVHTVTAGWWIDNPDENDSRWHYVYEGVHYARTLKKEEEEANSRYNENVSNLDVSHYSSNPYETDEPIMRYTDAIGNKGTLWCNPGPCTAGSLLKHGWATGVGTFLPLKLVEDVKKTLGEAVNKEIATFGSATHRKIFNITLDALLTSAETSDDPKLKSAAAMTTEQIKSNQVAFEKSQEDKSGSSIVVEAPVEEAPVEEAPVEEAPVDEGTEAPVEEWDDDCAGMDQCNIPIEGVDF